MLLLSDCAAVKPRSGQTGDLVLRLANIMILVLQHHAAAPPASIAFDLPFFAGRDVSVLGPQRRHGLAPVFGAGVS